MTRWHDTWCYKPDIEVRKGLPQCRNCNKFPNINTLVKNATVPNPFSQAPEDEPLGELNLYWPSSVVYSGPTGTKRSKPVKKGLREPKPSQAYPNRLGTDEFRLLRLHPSNDVEDPVWGELESYPLQRCPEYEATSYTWASEDGDASLCRPIFLGPYWDIQLQTTNCWSMLQAMRFPGKGSRMIWIDAICINQDDIEERDSQVSQMSQIYTGCRRVFLYLGPDITSPSGNQHPFRRELTAYSMKEAEAAKAQGFDLLNIIDLLHRRYFTRAWVIQELVLARQVVIQTRDEEFWMDGTTIQSLELKQVKTAPWIQHIAQRPFQAMSFYRALRQTRTSRCGDVRDKVFGLLALCAQDDTLPVLKPNYELSCVQTFVGVFSHILLNLQYEDVFIHASGQSAWGRYPSWVPDWAANGPDWLFRYHEHDATESIEKLAHNSTNFVFCHVTRDGRWLEESDGGLRTGGRVSPFHSVWHQGASVNAATGTLSINLVHLHKFRSAPKPVSSSRGLIVFAWKEGTTTMFLTSHSRLDKQVMAGDHIFHLYTEEHTYIYFVMREFDMYPNTFRLLALGVDLGFDAPLKFTPSQAWALEERLGIELHAADLLISLSQYRESFDLRNLVCSDIGECQKAFMWMEIRESIQEAVNRDTRGEITSEAWKFYDIEYVRTSNPSPWANDSADDYKLYGIDGIQASFRLGDWHIAQAASCLLSAFQGILNEARGLTPGFLESYLSRLDESLCAKRQDDYVIITLADRGSLHEGSVYQEFETEPVRYRSSTIRYRASKSELERVMIGTRLFRYLSGLTFAAKLTGELETDIARRGPRDEDRSLIYSVWPTEITEPFQIDGEGQQLNIA
ncbi:hypothetical protein ACHAPJ_012668 [Fusarium lateritium]